MQRYSRIRYSLINASVGFIAKVVHSALKVKKYLGAQAYTYAGLECFFSGEQPDQYKFSIYNTVNGEQKLTYCQDAQSLLFNIMNGRFAGGGMPFSPACLMNDGLLDVAFYNQTITGTGIFSLLHQMKAGNGVNAYDDNWTHIRGNKIVMENVNYKPGSMQNPENANPQLL